MILSTALLKYYTVLKKELAPVFFSDFSLTNVFQCHLVAAYSKCFEFNHLVNKKSRRKDSFFYSAALRGICEDLITLNFLKTQKSLDKDKLLYSYVQLQLVELSQVQSKFFSKNHPQQIVYNVSKPQEIIDSNTAILKTEWNKLGLNKDRTFPSVAQMATDAGLIELYNYVYAATSDMVHFSPHNLLRSGWSKNEKPHRHNFSPGNYNRYYDLFNRFYGSYLFTLFTKKFKKELKLNKKALEIIKTLEQELFLNSRWPELITFEEMNEPAAESIRLINAVRKIKLSSKAFNIPDQKTDELIKTFLSNVSKTRSKPE